MDGGRLFPKNLRVSLFNEDLSNEPNFGRDPSRWTVPLISCKYLVYYFNVIFFSEKDGKGGRKDRSRDMKKVDTAESSEDEDSSPAGRVPSNIVYCLTPSCLKSGKVRFLSQA
jgi:hypothetical protein